MNIALLIRNILKYTIFLPILVFVIGLEIVFFPIIAISAFIVWIIEFTLTGGMDALLFIKDHVVFFVELILPIKDEE